jgi:hypothetical protein
MIFGLAAVRVFGGRRLDPLLGIRQLDFQGGDRIVTRLAFEGST